MKRNIQKNKHLILLAAIILLLITVFSACTKADDTSEEAEKQEVPETSLTGRELMYIKNNGLYERIPGKDEATRISKDKYKKRFAFELRESSLPEVQYSLDGKYVYYY